MSWGLKAERQSVLTCQQVHVQWNKKQSKPAQAEYMMSFLLNGLHLCLTALYWSDGVLQLLLFLLHTALTRFIKVSYQWGSAVCTTCTGTTLHPVYPFSLSFFIHLINLNFSALSFCSCLLSSLHILWSICCIRYCILLHHHTSPLTSINYQTIYLWSMSICTPHSSIPSLLLL